MLTDKRIQNFWKHVNKEGPFCSHIGWRCWNWMGDKNQFGYGRWQIIDKGKRTRIVAHRISWFMAGNSIPEGRELDHLCRNRACVNPQHLELVTRAENTRRGISVGAIARRTNKCIRGHEGQWYVRKNGWRRCKICQKNEGAVHA